MGYEPSVLPGIALGIVAVLGSGVEGIERLVVWAVGRLVVWDLVRRCRDREMTFAVETAHKTCGGVEVATVALGALVEVFLVGLLMELLSHTCYAPIGQSVFHAAAHGLVVGKDASQYILGP